MTFNENEVKRDQSGKFDKKEGAPATIALPTEPTPVICERHGGAWGDDLTCEGCTYENGRTKPFPITPTKEDYAEARATLNIPEHVNPEDIPEADTRRIESRAQRIARTAEPLRAMEAGRPHYLDDNLDAIWNGEANGFSEAKFRENLDQAKRLREQLATGGVRPRDVIGTGYRGDTRKLANEYIDKLEREYSEAIRTRGRSFALNVDNAYAQYRHAQV